MHCTGLLGLVSQHAEQVSRGVSRPIPRGEVEGSGLGGLQAHTPGVGVSRPTPGGVSQHALRQTPHRRLLPHAVRILLECILVLI